MNVDELYHLAIWYNSQFPELNKLYKELLSPINHNANQPDKQPVEAQLDALAAFLTNQAFDELSLEQLKMLTSLGLDNFIGQAGAA